MSSKASNPARLALAQRTFAIEKNFETPAAHSNIYSNTRLNRLLK
jgi:hypothetical protein